MLTVSQLFIDMEQTVRLLDGLGKRHGAVHKYKNLRSPADAIKLLCINSPAFQKELIEAHKDGMGYQVIQGGRAIAGYEELALPFGSKDLYIVPVVVGSGGNVGKSLGFVALGVGLVAFAILTGGAGAGFMGLGGNAIAQGALFGGATSAISSIVGGIGLSMAISGVTSLIAPQPELPKPTGFRRFETRSGGSGDNIRATGTRGLSRATNQDQTYLYTGARNSSGAGGIVPVVFGKALIGSHLLGLDVVIDDSDNSGYITEVTRGGPEEVEIQFDRITNTYKAMGGVLRSRMLRESDRRPHNNNEGEQSTGSSGGPKYYELVRQETEILLDSTNKSTVKGVIHQLNQNRAFGLRDEDHLWKTYNWEIVFRLPNGLFDFVTPNPNPANGAKPLGQQRQPGSINYRVELRAVGRYNVDAEPVVGVINGTINANLDSSYPSEGFPKGFSWVHSFSYQQIDNVKLGTEDTTDNFRIKPFLTITEFFCAGKNYFKLEVVQTGYKNVATSSPKLRSGSKEMREHDSYGKLAQQS